MTIKRIKNKKECDHSFVVKGVIGFAAESVSNVDILR